MKEVQYDGKNVAGEHGMMTGWPVTFEESDWCGEFQAKASVKYRSRRDDEKEEEKEG